MNPPAPKVAQSSRRRLEARNPRAAPPGPRARGVDLPGRLGPDYELLGVLVQRTKVVTKEGRALLGHGVHRVASGIDAGEHHQAGQFGRISAVSDLPKDRVLIGFIKEAVRLNQTGTRLPARPKPKERKELSVPAELVAALGAHKKAQTAFENFSYSHKKEYVQWITEAKGEETRKRRLATAIDWMAEGKSRHWRYAKC